MLFQLGLLWGPGEGVTPGKGHGAGTNFEKRGHQGACQCLYSEEAVPQVQERWTKEEQRIIERAKEALLKEVGKGFKDMRLMGIKLTEILELLHNIRCEMCVSKGRFPERQLTRKPSIGRDDSRRLTEDMRRTGERLCRQAAAASGMQVLDDSRPRPRSLNMEETCQEEETWQRRKRQQSRSGGTQQVHGGGLVQAIGWQEEGGSHDERYHHQ